ncbi:glycosyltransferase family 2 protein [Olivibacter domesticus]|uniref:Glycosyltransferase involved in cell wall bisynthesis n=1 Tax=Olivibacter domesticus TaxID=407022 RepID=A0A1H7YFM0_OLID1|nr:glycosyltransferase family 2 protein [Olivibacter domesticus]SEM44745.1 Glycosyltransferase involved in cell wall bisynthesis [Olivibacter domesticus]
MSVLVSVIVPNYNHGEFLKARLDSILNQTFSDFEVIILDDCSTDDSKYYIEQYRSHEKVSNIIYNTTNSGSAFQQWDRGINLAQGQYIWIAESDDWCEPGFLDALVGQMEIDVNCAISYCQSSVLFGGEIRWQSHHNKLSEVISGKEFIRSFLSEKPAIFNASMAIWRKALYNKISKEYMDYRYCGDWFFWIQLAQLGKIHISGRVLNYFRKHGKDLTTSSKRNCIDVLEGMKIANYLYTNGLIVDREYFLSYKRHLKLYWHRKSQVNDNNIKRDIENLFRRPLSKKVSKLKALLSAYWSKLSSKKIELNN